MGRVTGVVKGQQVVMADCAGRAHSSTTSTTNANIDITVSC